MYLRWLLTAGIGAGVAACSLFTPSSTPEVALPSPLRSGEAPAREVQAAKELPLVAALEQKLLECEINGNGRDMLSLSLRNTTGSVIAVTVAAGDTFSAGASSLVALRNARVELSVGNTAQAMLETAAVSSDAGAGAGDARYFVSNTFFPRLSPLLRYLGNHPEVSPAVAQTAVLALTENLPVRAFAKFPSVAEETPSAFDTTPFRVEVGDIIRALTILREIGVPDQELALTIDPQLKIEAMIEPLAHAAAMRYYGLSEESEWEYWKNELTQGDVRTRHYALYGIAKYFPGVALQMLPQWVREPRTNVIFRQSAILALAETQKIAAVPVLAQLAHELGTGTELGQSAHQALAVLNKRLDRSSAQGRFAVAFRTSKDATEL